MPNLLADSAILPELVQNGFTGAKLAEITLDLLADSNRRQHIQRQLKSVADSLGGPGACHRAAQAVLNLMAGTLPARKSRALR